MGQLDTYKAKRDFAATPEPSGKASRRRKKGEPLQFVVQKHAASHLHYDLRLELDGVMKSWAVPKGPSVDPEVKRLAMEVEDHPIEYNSFEGTIPKGQYGGGTVMIWDRGTYVPRDVEPGDDHAAVIRHGLQNGKLDIVFEGERLRGAFTLIRTKRDEKSQWLFFKRDDSDAQPGVDITEQYTTSIDSGRSMEEIATGEGGSSVWHSDRVSPDVLALLDAFEQDALEPMRATRGSLGEGWWAIEPAVPGVRVLAITASGATRIVSLDNGAQQVAQDTSSVERALAKLAGTREGPLVFDGILSNDGHTLVAVDLLIDDRELLLLEPYIERRMRLEALLREAPASVEDDISVNSMEVAVEEDAMNVLQAFSAHRGTAKRIDSPYEAGESEFWRELPAMRGQQHNRRLERHDALIPADATDVVVHDGPREVQLTNLQKPFWPELGITKGDLLRYYATVSPLLLPHLVNRAMVMKRYPHGAHGEFFFMKRAPSPRPDWVETCSIEHASKSVIDFPMVQNLASLLWVINLGCIDLNPWYSRCDDVDRPDFLHFDLDPVPNATFDRVREVALHLKEYLDELQLPSYPKTSGSKGIHVYVPIVRSPVQKQVWTIAKSIAQELESRHPKVVTAEYRIAKRPEGRVLVDYNQNAWGRTLASIYSVRPKPEATVSTPVTWREIEDGVRTEDFTLLSVPERLADSGDLWAPVLSPDGRVSLEHLL